MDPEDQSNNAAEPATRKYTENQQQDLPLSDSLVGALFKAGSGRPSGASWQPPSPEELQRQFPQYEIRGILGRGGMGAVYKGWQKSLRRFVAIKILPAGIDDGGMDFAERFKQEAWAMAKFKHPGIVAVHDAGETPEGLLYFIMECVEGKDVAQLVAERGRLPPAEALRIAGRVCEAVAYAHERGVIHRDIKPSNVMLEADGTVKVADFGLAKLSSAESTVNTLSSVQIGSLDFMPPEALHGSGNADHRADIYAVGGMLYQMLTGKAPHGRFEPPSVAVRGLDRRFDAIVDKAMHADAAKRYSTATELHAELARIAGKQDAIRSEGRPGSKPLLAILLVVAIVGIAAIIFAQWKKARTGATPASREVPADAVSTIPSLDYLDRDGERLGLTNPGLITATEAARWRDAFAESPLKEIIAAAEHTAQGYRLPEGNHWTVSPQPMRSGALRVRATGIGEKYASLYVTHDDRQFERIRFVGRNSEWLLSRGVPSASEKDIASTRATSPLDEKPHELLMARIGGRLRVMVDGQPFFDEPDPNATPGSFVLDIFPGAKITAEKVEYLELDGVPEAEALKLIGVGATGK